MRENWIVPCNPKHLDIKNHLLESDEVVFKRVRPKNIGDIAYIYVSGKGDQIGQIKYKGIIIDNDCKQEVLDKHSYAVAIESYGQGPFNYMLIKIFGEFPDGTITLDDLKDHDFSQVRVQARTTRRLQSFLDEKDKLLIPVDTNSIHN